MTETKSTGNLKHDFVLLSRNELKNQSEIDTLREENKKLKNILASLLNACMIADAEGELYESVTGELLDKAQKALK
jgi:hypothetical protein